jgi:predicted nucleotidyltransferase
MEKSKTVHADFAERIVEALKRDDRFIGLLAGGSFRRGMIDEFSDLDLVVVAEDAVYASVMSERRELAARLGNLLYAFTGQHVGEPRLLICLYADPLLHVDLKFVRLDGLDVRVETPVILWDRDGRVAKRLEAGQSEWPNRAPEWFDERFWVWIHYVASKLGRGEILDVVEALTLIRSWVLGPMIARRRNLDQRGVRNLETLAPEMAERLARTVPNTSFAQCADAIRETIALYQELRLDYPPSNRNAPGERVVTEYVEGVISRNSR